MRRTLNKYSLHITLLLFFLLIGVPILVFANSKSTENRTQALATTTVQFSPSSSSSSPITATIGTSTSLDVYVIPNENQVSYISLEVLYDTNYFDTNSVTFVTNSETTLQLREGPIYTTGKIQVAYDIGNNAENVLRTQTKVGTLIIKPIAETSKRSMSKIQFGTQTTALSLTSNDSAQENVISNTLPAYFRINAPSTGGKGKDPR